MEIGTFFSFLTQFF